MPLAAMGARGIEMLATQPADRAVEEVISQPMELVERASTAPAG
jgi:hypothetical protein